MQTPKDGSKIFLKDVQDMTYKIDMCQNPSVEYIKAHHSIITD